MFTVGVDYSPVNCAILDLNNDTNIDLAIQFHKDNYKSNQDFVNLYGDSVTRAQFYNNILTSGMWAVKITKSDTDADTNNFFDSTTGKTDFIVLNKPSNQTYPITDADGFMIFNGNEISSNTLSNVGRVITFFILEQEPEPEPEPEP